MRPPEAPGATEPPRGYLDALAIQEAQPGTVCLVLQHYERGRHVEPYRIMYPHGWRLPGEHWHANEVEVRACTWTPS